jgi:hypothetical protein
MTKVRRRGEEVWHETEACIDGRAIVVAETSHNLLLRCKGRRQTLSLPWTLAFLRAAEAEAAMQRRLKREEAKQKKVQRRTSGAAR